MDRDVEREALGQRDAHPVAAIDARIAEERGHPQRLVQIVAVGPRAAGVGIGRAVAVAGGGLDQVGREMADGHGCSPREAAMITFWRSEVPE